MLDSRATLKGKALDLTSAEYRLLCLLVRNANRVVTRDIILNELRGAASLHQAFAHCAIFPTAASGRSLGRVSVPMWPVTLSGRLWIVALVGRYLTN